MIRSQSEFAEMCVMKSRTLSVYVGRGKVVVDENGGIEDTHPLNNAFMRKRRGEKGLAGKLPKAVRIKMDEKAAMPQPAVTTGDVLQDPSAPPTMDEFTQLTLERLRETVEKLKNENQKLKINNEKVVGQFVQVDHVTHLIIQMSEAIHLAWENEIEDLIVRLAGRYGLTREEIVEMKKQKIDSANISRTRAVIHAKKMLRNLQNQTSDKRGVGEHD